MARGGILAPSRICSIAYRDRGCVILTAHGLAERQQ
jgi:hypothetical protein